MAVNIVEKSNFEGRCESCGCKFTYELEDIRSFSHKVNDNRGVVTCPNCGTDVLNIWHNRPEILNLYAEKR